MQSLLDEAHILTKKLVETYHPEKVIMFGSAARGDTHKDSDIDVLVIKKSMKKKRIG